MSRKLINRKFQVDLIDDKIELHKYMRSMVMNTGDISNYQRIASAIQYLENNFKRQPELEEVAAHIHLSPFHFQRMFSEWAGISPKKFLQYLTASYLKEKLKENRSLVETAEEAGLSSQSRVYDLFTTLEAVTPQEYRTYGKGIYIRYGIQPSPFGMCLIGITERGICWLSFLQNDEDGTHEVIEMKNHWHASIFMYDNELASQTVQRIFNRRTQETKLHLLVKGTNFQVKVWDALLRIGRGKITTYQEIAAQIDKPKGLQAVGSAVGANHIAYLIPCHRVIRKEGTIGDYRWSSSRKKSMLGWEMAQEDLPSDAK